MVKHNSRFLLLEGKEVQKNLATNGGVKCGTADLIATLLGLKHGNNYCICAGF